MENCENKDGKACGTKTCCGKAMAAALLLAIGGLGGYFLGRKCAGGAMMCGDHHKEAGVEKAMETPAPATKK